ncbi:MAG: transposase family protein [Acidobacteria bacterium]|nr:transposase family protein [Acidobacteriota bacterium]
MSLSHAVPDESSAGHEVPNISRLLEMLGRLTDPRSPQGKRHELVFTLACAVVAVLAGACNYRQLASQVGDFPQSLLATLGGRWSWFGCRYGWPSEATLRRVCQRIDAGELDLLIGSWLFERAHRDVDGLLVIALDARGPARRLDRRQRPGHPVLRDDPRRGCHRRPDPGARGHQRDHPGRHPAGGYR